MKLAIEHLQQSIAAAERTLTDAKNAVVASRRQLEDHEKRVVTLTSQLADYQSALVALRGPTQQPEQLTRATLKIKPQQVLKS